MLTLQHERKTSCFSWQIRSIGIAACAVADFLALCAFSMAVQKV